MFINFILSAQVSQTVKPNDKMKTTTSIAVPHSAPVYKTKTDTCIPGTQINSTGVASTKYSTDEIERKRRLAMEKRKMKNIISKPTVSFELNVTPKRFYSAKQVTSKHVDTTKFKEKVCLTPNTSIMIDSQKSPSKYSPEEIESKKAAALERLRQKSGDTHKLNEAPYLRVGIPQVEISPIKCPPEEIEKKKQQALRKRQLSGGARRNSEGSSLTSSQELSPFKCTPEPVEQNKLTAFDRHLQRSGSSDSIGKASIGCELVGSQGEISPFKCTPDEIENKKLAALARRMEKSKQNLNAKLTS